MAKVGIVMGSDSDMPVMSKAADILEKLGIDYEMKIISAHREPDVFFEYAKTAEEKGFKVIIAGAGMAAHLPGMCAAIFPMPVIGIPMHTTSLGGRDSLYSIVQMPSGIPVATVAINGGANAGLLAAKILATSDAELLSRLKAYSQDLKEQVEKKDARLQEVGYKNPTDCIHSPDRCHLPLASLSIPTKKTAPGSSNTARHRNQNTRQTDLYNI